ncbi:MAG: hypothetical protein N2Z22_03155 [Turneriella sp.]|nr:hypothetical protein [Turneriella sp.]
MAQDPEFLLMLPIAAFFPVVYSTQQIARFFGADAHWWIEKVIALGKIGFEELSSASGLSVSRLNRIFAALPTHPVAIDHKGRRYLSADALAALENIQFCNNCGGTLEIEHNALLQCPYCRSDYAVALEKQTQVENTPPLIVSTIASFLRAWGMMFFAIFALMAIFGVGVETYSFFFSDRKPDGTGWLVVVIVAVFGTIAHGVFDGFARKIEKGKGYFVLTLKLALLSFLIWPIFALRAVSSPRSQFFFGRLGLDKIQAWFAEKRYLPLAEFAQRPRAPEPDAMAWHTTLLLPASSTRSMTGAATC